MDINTIHLGACEDVLKTFPDAFFDSIITDPPYGLGTREPTAEDIEHYLKGQSIDTGGDFMGKEWSMPSVTMWKECYRVLKPGGYLLAMAGTRTWDIMSIGIRAAGFVNRETISSLFGSPCLQWLHGQGFPKSLNIAKELRKRAKKEPARAEVLLALADKYEGWGTALKPAWEPILMFRKPFEGTVVEQVELTGTGGINIDGTRVKHSDPEDFEKHKAHVDRIKAEGGIWAASWKNSSDLAGASEVTEAGRWPANVVVSHLPSCVPSGTRKVKASGTSTHFHEAYEGESATGFLRGVSHPGNQHGDPDGTETVTDYECAPGCPVLAVDMQSAAMGMHSAGNKRPMNHQIGNRVYQGGWTPISNNPDYYADRGGASRFFAQFMPDAPFLYTGKASKREKNAGIVSTKLSTKKGERLVVLKPDVTPEETQLLVDELDADDLDPRIPRPECDVPEVLLTLFVPIKQEDNNHPTVKPVSLMAWLAKMVTPKEGVILDPYMGSGTTCVGALEANCNYVGIEKDPLYMKLADKRLKLLTEVSLATRHTTDNVDAVFANIDENDN